jgi:hypothetical protein
MQVTMLMHLLCFLLWVARALDVVLFYRTVCGSPRRGWWKLMDISSEEAADWKDLCVVRLVCDWDLPEGINGGRHFLKLSPVPLRLFYLRPQVLCRSLSTCLLMLNKSP